MEKIKVIHAKTHSTGKVLIKMISPSLEKYVYHPGSRQSCVA